MISLFEGILFHVTAFAAETILGWTGNEHFVRNFLLQPVQHSGLGHDDDFFGPRIFAERDHFLRRTNFVGQHPHRVSAFGMRDDRRVRIFFANSTDAARREFNVHVTIPLPQIHFAPGPLHDPRAEILIGHKQDVPIGRC